MTHGIEGNLGDMSMMDLFRMEAENQCNQLAEDLLALEKDPTASVAPGPGGRNRIPGP